MIKIINIIISLHLIYNTKPQKQQQYEELMICTPIKIEREHSSSTNELLFDNLMNLTGFQDTDHGSFEFSSIPLSECSNDNTDKGLDLEIYTNFLDVEFHLDDYSKLNPKELSKIIEVGSDSFDEKIYTIEDVDRKTTTNNSKIESTSKQLNEIRNNYLFIKTDLKIENRNLYLNEQCLTNFNVESTNEKVSKINTHISSKFIELFKKDVEQYIECTIPKFYRSFYLQKLESITNITNLLDEFKEQELSFSLDDKEFEKVLLIILMKFKNVMKFDRETCNLFMKELKIGTCKIVKLYNQNWKLLSNEEKILNFVCEFMKLYKYVYYIPEILTLGGIVVSKLSVNSVFTLHLMNVFIERIGKLEKNKDFIKCLMNKIFSHSLRHCLNLFLVPNSYIKCDKNHKNLLLFLLEIHRDVRNKKQIRIKKTQQNEINRCQIVHMKVALLLFLYQHIIFLKFYNVIEDIKTLIDLVKRTINTEECVICIFDDFMRLIKSQIGKLK